MKSYILGAVLVLVAAGPVRAQTGSGTSPWLIPPVDAGISRHFEAPESEYGPGHRGVDYAAPSGTAVRAAGPGSVTFAGPVAGAYAVTLAHSGGMETTYSMLSAVHVGEGQNVGQGTWIGRSGQSHPGAQGGLHFAVKIDGRYVDPLDYLGAIDVAGAIHLAPIPDESTVSGGLQAAFEAAGVGVSECLDISDAGDVPSSPPNDNVAVVIGGISSRTEGGASPTVFDVPAALGYPDDRIYRFSYRGLGGPRWHEPYDYEDTNRDLVGHAERLAVLLDIVAHAHPGAGIDIIAHSQGGIVARTYLEGMAELGGGRAPAIEHLVTFSTPHSGSALAHLGDDLRDESLTGSLFVNAANLWARLGGPIPSLDSPAVRQQRTDSELIEWLATEDVAYGARVLALSVPDDLIATADRTAMPGELSRVVPPEGMTVRDAPAGAAAGPLVAEALEASRKLAQPGIGPVQLAADAAPDVLRAARAHGRILESGYARRLAYAWLADLPEPCRSGWDAWGHSSGALIAAAERRIASAYGGAEALLAARAGLTRPYWGVRTAQHLVREREKDRAPSVGGVWAVIRRGL